MFKYLTVLILWASIAGAEDSYISTPAYSGPSRSVTVLDPDMAFTVGESVIEFNWEGFSNNEVKLELWLNGSWVCDVTDWISNPGVYGGEFSGSVTIPEDIPVSADYKVRLVDSRNREAFSEMSFLVRQPVTVTTTIDSEKWCPAGEGTVVRWTGALGSYVTVNLMCSGSTVAVLASQASNNGVLPLLPQPELGLSEDEEYYILVIDNTAAYGCSNQFGLSNLCFEGNPPEEIEQGDEFEIGWAGGGLPVSFELVSGSAGFPLTDSIFPSKELLIELEIPMTISPGNYALLLSDGSGAQLMGPEFTVLQRTQRSGSGIGVPNRFCLTGSIIAQPVAGAGYSEMIDDITYYTGNTSEVGSFPWAGVDFGVAGGFGESMSPDGTDFGWQLGASILKGKLDIENTTTYNITMLSGTAELLLAKYGSPLVFGAGMTVTSATVSPSETQFVINSANKPGFGISAAYVFPLSQAIECMIRLEYQGMPVNWNYNWVNEGEDVSNFGGIFLSANLLFQI